MVIKLYYFNGRGICEPIRWILSFGGIEFEDIRAPVNDKPLMLQTLPAEIKEKCRWQQAPLVEFDDGKSLTQSLAISRYFARKCNLIPENSYEEALCDEYVDAARDYWNGFFAALIENSMEEFNKASRTRYLDVFERIIQSNDGNHLVGSRISWADIWMGFIFQHLKMISGIDVTIGYPSLQRLSQTVLNAPRIKEWNEKRPKTKF